MATRLATLNYSRDPKTGRVRVIKSFHVDTEDEIESAGDATAMGYRPTGEINARNWDPQDIDQGLQVDVHYEGLSADYGEGVEAAKWSFRPHWEKEPIEKHPKISYLIDNYGGTEDPETKRITFTRKLSRSSTKTVGTDNSSKGLYQQETTTKEVDNPAYGLNESGWLSMQGIAVARFTDSSASHLEGVGEIVDALPGNAPDFGIDEDRNWIKAPPIVDEIPQPAGEPRLFEIELQYMLSPKGGWPPAVYNFIDV